MRLPLVLAGRYGSPYTLKMRGVLRYRHMPFQWMLRDSEVSYLPSGRPTGTPRSSKTRSHGSSTDEVVCDVSGRDYRQAPFGYQGKCLGWLRDAHAALTDADRMRVASLLDGTGCEQLLA